MKKLVRNSDGTYSGAVGSQYELTSQETRKVRELLSQGPIHVSTIAAEIGVMTHPARLSSLQRYLSHLELHTREAEMIHGPNRRGRLDFKGWRLTPHGEKMLEIS